MADKMIRTAGRSASGVAKALRTDENGKLEVRVNNKETIYSSALTIPANSYIEIFFDVNHVEYEFSFRSVQNFESRVVLDQYIKLKNTSVLTHSAITLSPTEIISNVTVSTVKFKPVACDRGRIRLFNDSSEDQVMMGVLLMGLTNPKEQSINIPAPEQYALKAKDAQGTDVFLSAETDYEGQNALRIVDAAPWAYVLEKDAIRVMQDKKHNHLLYSGSNVQIPAGGYVDFEEYFDISDFVKTITTCRFSPSATFDITAVYSMEGSTFAMLEKESHTSKEYASSVFGVKTGTLRYIRITNKGTSDVTLTGIEIRGLKA